jgi:hypothetical protein
MVAAGRDNDCNQDGSGGSPIALFGEEVVSLCLVKE